MGSEARHEWESLHGLYGRITDLYGGIYQMSFLLSRSKVDLLKELKQVRLQVLEVPAKLEKDSDRHP